MYTWLYVVYSVKIHHDVMMILCLLCHGKKQGRLVLCNKSSSWWWENSAVQLLFSISIFITYAISSSFVSCSFHAKKVNIFSILLHYILVKKMEICFCSNTTGMMMVYPFWNEHQQQKGFYLSTGIVLTVFCFKLCWSGFYYLSSWAKRMDGARSRLVHYSLALIFHYVNGNGK